MEPQNRVRLPEEWLQVWQPSHVLLQIRVVPESLLVGLHVQRLAPSVLTETIRVPTQSAE